MGLILEVWLVKLLNLTYRLSKFTIMSTCEGGGRRIKIEVRGLPATRHILMYISERIKRVGDLATKLKFGQKKLNPTIRIRSSDPFHIVTYYKNG